MSMAKIFSSAFFGPETIIIECRSRVASIYMCHTSEGPNADGHQEGELGGPHHNDQEHHQIHVWHHFQNGITYAIQIDYREHL